MLAVTPLNRIMSSATQTKNISGMMWETGQRIHSLLNSPGLNLTKHLLEKSKSNQWKPHHNQPQRHSVHRPVALKCFVLYHWVKKTHLECMFIYIYLECCTKTMQPLVIKWFCIIRRDCNFIVSIFTVFLTVSGLVGRSGRDFWTAKAPVC